MVQKNNKWNLSKEKGEELIHKYIIDILRNTNNHKMLISDLIIFLNLQTKHIKLIHNSKKKPISAYIRCIYGSFENFLNSFSIYSVIIDESKPYAIFHTKEYSYNIFKEYKDWILIEEEDNFILV